jgi:hypothetical protein
MNTLIDFLIRASISLSVLYLVYWLFLRKVTLFRVIRFYLVFSLILSVILPFIRIRYEVEVPLNGLMGAKNGVWGQTGIMGALDGATLTGIIGIVFGSIYLMGASFFLARLICQVIILLTSIRKNGFYVKEQVKIVENSKYKVPFSFFHFVFINPQYISTDELDNIIAHEKVHIRENHSFDLLLLELLSIVFWFNPFVWLIDRSIKQNHEHLADEGVIAQGYSIGRYHSILLNQLLGMEILRLTNHLNYSLNANRLKMTKQKKTPKLRALNIIWSLPVVFVLLVAFAEPVYTTTDRAGDSFFLLSDKVERNIALSIIVKDMNGDPIPGANGVIKGSEIGTVSDVNGKINLTVSETDVVIISFLGFEDAVVSMEKLTSEKKSETGYGIKVVLKPKSGELSDVEKKELMKKKEAALKQEQAQKENSPEMSESEVLKMKIKEMDKLIKELTLKQEKLKQMEEDESIDKEELAAKQKQLEVYLSDTKKKRAQLEKKAQELK